MLDLIERTYGARMGSQYAHRFDRWYHCGDMHRRCVQCGAYRGPESADWILRSKGGSEVRFDPGKLPDCVTAQALSA